MDPIIFIYFNCLIYEAKQILIKENISMSTEQLDKLKYNKLGETI